MIDQIQTVDPDFEYDSSVIVDAISLQEIVSEYKELRFDVNIRYTIKELIAIERRFPKVTKIE